MKYLTHSTLTKVREKAPYNFDILVNYILGGLLEAIYGTLWSVYYFC